MKVTIIGANSYIARNLLVVLKRRMPDAILRLYDIADIHADGEKEYRSIRILETDSASQMDLQADLIFMFVGKTGTIAGFDDYNTFIDINERALLNVLKAYREQNSRAKIIFPSTRLVYKGCNRPLKETDEKEFRTIYSINKFACEQYLEQFSRVFDVRYCVFRICVPYGSLIPGVSSYGTVEFMQKKALNGENICLYGDGNVRRTFTYIEDLCNNLLDGALSSDCLNNVFNIGGEDLSLKDVAELIAPYYGVSVDYIDYPDINQKIESGSTVFDATKLNLLGIKTEHTMRDWVKTIVEMPAEVSGGGV